MKKIILFLSIILFAVVAQTKAQENDRKDRDREWRDRPKIEGSGKIITKEVSVQSFDELTVNGVFSVLLTQGDKEQVKIEADDNLQEYFQVKNEGSKLVVEMKKDINFNTEKGLKVYITFKKIKNMVIKTIGNVTSDQSLSFDDLKIGSEGVGSVDLKLTAQNVDINNKGVGNVRLNGKADNVTIKNNGVGSIRAGDFVVQKMDIDNSGVGSAEVNAQKELTIRESFLGRVTNRGSAPTKRQNRVVI